MKNIYELVNNRQNDVFRYARRALGYIVIFALGYLYCHFDLSTNPVKVTCESNYIVYQMPQTKLLPKTGADVTD